jgi:GNAT superfamily N-acetyltransferase
MVHAALAIKNTDQLPSFIVDVTRIEGVVTYKTLDSTAGFVRYQNDGGIEYIFVRGLYRRQGLAKRLLQEVEHLTGCKPHPLPPISPLGAKLFGT